MTCDCGCCAGVEAVTPTPILNPPGLPALTYRAGTYATFRASMLARLAGRRALDPLTTREPDDPAIALLDCWAMVGEVLTFYQERIANEGYLGTATEPESLDHLGRLAGHLPRPPLASGTYLAYTLDPGARSLIPAGSGVRSQAANGQLPQTFETAEDLVAREEWNTLAVRLTDPPDITLGNVDSALVSFAVDGTTANLRKGDRLLFAFAPSGLAPDLHARTVADSTVDFLASRTDVTLVSRATPLDAFTTAVTALADAVRVATGDPVTGVDPAAARIVTDILTPLAALLTPTLTPAGALGTVADYLQRLPEAIALAARGATCALTDWLGGDLDTVQRDGRTLLTLAAQLARRSDPEMAQLRALARSLVCPDNCSGDSQQDEGGPTCKDPYQAVGLVALTPVLPALRRPPSRPPRSARALDTPVQQLFRPDSDVHPRLLAAADPRLAPVYDAWRRERITDPPPLAGLTVLRLRAAIALARKKPQPAAADTRVDQILLDAVHDTVLPGRPVLVGTGDGTDTVVLFPDRVLPAQLDVTDPSGRKIGEVTVTMLEFDTPLDPAKGPLGKGTPVWAQGEPLTPVGAPIPDDVGQAAIDLDRCHDGLKPGRWVIVSGERTDVPHTSGVRAAELAMVAGVSQRLDRTVDGRPVLQRGQGPQTRLLLAGDLAYTYRRATVRIHGNVVAATQGETRDDILGNGDAGVPGQVFPLHLVADATPLTWTAADNPLGAQNSLTTRVNGVAWHETPALALSGPNDHTYELHGASVAFGDGVHGARLPSGSQNVTARYRTGAGASGNLPADRVNQLAARPLGVSAVTNPLPATGGADGDGPEDARTVIPLRLRALDRLVSVQDYEDFTRARAGIGKASAVKLFDGTREVVHITVAAVGDAPVDPLSDLFTMLERSLVDFGDAGVPVRVAARELRLIVLDAGVKVLPDYAWELVEPAVRAALAARFGFAARTLGRPAFLSEAIAAIQAVEGVDYTDVHVFADVPGDVTPIQLAQLAAQLTNASPCLPALPAHFEQTEYRVTSGDTLTTVTQRFGLHLDELAALNPPLTSTDLHPGQLLTVFRGVRPAQLAVLPADVPEALTLRRIP
ncbi:putative baseplate assembly protein [Kitasatospora aureofaciens]|uniref:putative baseplate assembly protein n=1 Tax=Kitasatospora aureofaciens TaxID=1894 RepID=UPI001C48EBDB|nr:putative baseplate assembly protein [Kitasatospora aureofaciens]MBV6696776.1 putative baseplate assembly protein [Kitasatospora aureofaciens]